MSPDLWQRVEELFHELDELHPGERERRLAHADPDVAAEVRKLLAAPEQISLRIGEALQREALAASGLVRAGDRAGPFRFVQPIGRGGMGEVWLGERAEGDFTQRVALKIVRRFAPGDELGERFRQERRILASLDHPYIARFLDGGETDSGLAYIAMEFVDGLPLDRRLDTAKPSLEERLKLFVKICAAVEYAHGKLLLHRDLKPSNILVDDRGDPKLLDFGIAKLLSSERHEHLTGAAGALLTPEYASPEQVRGESLSVSSDVYSLGVLFYEILGGGKPYAIRDTSPGAILEAVCGADPPPPSRLAPSLSPDLDAIAMKALRKEPHLRYAGVRLFADDVERFLQGRPVLAHAGTWTYRASKFLRRNRVPALAVLGAAVLLAVFVANTILQFRRTDAARQRAQEASRRAEAVSSFLVDVFGSASPERRRSAEPITARELLDTGAAAISARLQNDPSTRAAILVTMSRAYTGLGLFRQALPLAEEARAILQKAATPDVAMLAHATHFAAHAALQIQDYDLAGKRAEEALETANRSVQLASSPEETLERQRLRIQVRSVVAHLREDAARYEDAIALHRENIRETAEIDGQEVADRGNSVFGLALVLKHQGRFKEAEELLLRNIRAKESRFGKNDLSRSLALNNLAVMYLERGEHARAEALFREVRDIRVQLVGPKHNDVARAAANLGNALALLGRRSEALAELGRAEEIFRSIFGDRHDSIQIVREMRGTALASLGRYAEAEILLRGALRFAEDNPGPAGPQTAPQRIQLARILVETGRANEALRILTPALQEIERGAAAEATTAFEIALVQGDSYRRLGRFTDARARYLKAVGQSRHIWPEGSAQTFAALLGLAQSEAAQANVPACLAAVKEARTTLIPSGALFDPQPVLLEIARARCLAASGQDAEAQRILTESASVLARHLGETHFLTRQARLDFNRPAKP